ncbi:MAG: hypothetical protein ABI604_13125 [Nitrospirota bacterium]
METEWVSFGMAGLWSWVIMIAWTIGIAVLAWWFFMPNPMDRDRKPKKKS